MGYEQDRRLGSLQNIHEIKSHLPRGDGVKVTERLVHQKNIWLDGESAGNGDPLLHPTRQIEGVISLLAG